MIRDRFALAITGLSAAALTTMAALAMLEPTRRSTDIVVLWLAGALHLGLLLTWVFIPRLPRWIVAGWGLILIALGLGVIITAPIPAGAGNFPWALVGLVVIGLVTMIVSVVHSPGETERLV
jgi:peptidoglycan/LPS O-acetylase OafA/YrhL